MAPLFFDLRIALRSLRRSPLFVIVTVLSLALGIGANTAIFTLLDQLLLRRLPVAEPERLVMLYQRGAHNGSNRGDRMHSYPMYQDYQQRAEPLSEVLCRRLVPASVATDNQTERLLAEVVSGNYFTMLGVSPAAGRVFNSNDDDQMYLGHPVVVLSYNYWSNRFNRDPGVVGRKILVNNYPMIIVGVSAKDFAGIDPTESPDVRVPILMAAAMMPEWGNFRMDDRRSRWVQVFARLKSGHTVESARTPLQALFTQVRAHEMALPAAARWSAYSRDEFMRGQMLVETAAVGYSGLRNAVSTALVVLMAMVGLVLLIACANVANLLIARGFARERETAVRLSLGATRWRVIRYLLTENLLLAMTGGLGGLVLAALMTRGLLAFVPREGTALLVSGTPDLRILAFTLVLTVFTGLVFGLMPALGATRADPWTTLKSTMGSIAGRGSALFARKSLVVAQVALSCVLLFGAGLFVRSLQNLNRTDTGLALDNLVSFQLAPALSGYDAPRTSQLYERLLDGLRAVPIVTSAAAASVPILAGDDWDSYMSVEGHSAQDGEDMQAFMNALSPGYFQTMRIPVQEGRDFRASDAREQPAVAIVNRRFANHFFPGGTAIGKHVGFGNRPGNLSIEIVGVVADSLYEGPRQGVRRQVFVPQWGRGGTTIYVRTRAVSTAIFDVIRQQMRQIDPAMPIYAIRTVQAQLDQTLLSDRLVATLSAAFGGLATLLAAIGLYGVMAFVVMRRSKELGIRLALGARRGSVVWLVMKEVLLLLVTGLVVGMPAAIGLGRTVSSQLFGVQSFDVGTAVGAVTVLALIAAAAGLIPAYRAGRIDPIRTLRYE